MTVKIQWVSKNEPDQPKEFGKIHTLEEAQQILLPPCEAVGFWQFEVLADGMLEAVRFISSPDVESINKTLATIFDSYKRGVGELL